MQRHLLDAFQLAYMHCRCRCTVAYGIKEHPSDTFAAGSCRLTGDNSTDSFSLFLSKVGTPLLLLLLLPPNLLLSDELWSFCELGNAISLLCSCNPCRRRCDAELAKAHA